jgi:drug/metabolite transporter (DMT)-like permease
LLVKKLQARGREDAVLPPVPSARFRFAPIDALVLLTTVVWGANYAIVKAALAHIPHLGFNALRLALASVLFLVVLAFYDDSPQPPDDGNRLRGGLFASARRIGRRDWAVILVLSVIGQFIYQLFFMAGISMTSVANSSLIQGSSPVVITLLAAAVGHERPSPWHYAGAALSMLGIYLLVGVGVSLSAQSWVGDLLMLAGVFCWATYVVASRPLLERCSPLAFSGYSMAIGALFYVPVGVPALRTLPWSGVPWTAWAALVYSAVFSLFLAYIVWYTSIKRVGNVRTAMYSNLIPVVALVTAVVFLGDRLDFHEVVGAGTVLAGVLVTRLARPSATDAPAEE